MSLENKVDIEWYYNEIKRHHGTFENEREFKEVIFECGCLCCEHIGFDPSKKPNLVKYNMQLQLKHLLKKIVYIYNSNKLPLPIKTPNLDKIKEILK